jgi:hypothetical protein
MVRPIRNDALRNVRRCLAYEHLRTQREHNTYDNTFHIHFRTLSEKHDAQRRQGVHCGLRLLQRTVSGDPHRRRVLERMSISQTAREPTAYGGNVLSLFTVLCSQPKDWSGRSPDLRIFRKEVCNTLNFTRGNNPGTVVPMPIQTSSKYSYYLRLVAIIVTITRNLKLARYLLLPKRLYPRSV